MAIYTLTTSLIENIPSTDIELFGSLLGVFTNIESGHKLAIDTNRQLYILYSNAKVDANLRFQYEAWKELLSKMLNRVCEFIPVDIDITDKDQAFLEVASSVNGSKKIIVYSRNTNCPYDCNDDNEVEHNGKSISVLDKDEAVSEINEKNSITTYGDNSPIINGNNNKVKNKLSKP